MAIVLDPAKGGGVRHGLQRDAQGIVALRLGAGRRSPANRSGKTNCQARPKASWVAGVGELCAHTAYDSPETAAGDDGQRGSR